MSIQYSCYSIYQTIYIYQSNLLLRICCFSCLQRTSSLYLEQSTFTTMVMYHRVSRKMLFGDMCIDIRNFLRRFTYLLSNQALPVFASSNLCLNQSHSSAPSSSSPTYQFLLRYGRCNHFIVISIGIWFCIGGLRKPYGQFFNAPAYALILSF